MPLVQMIVVLAVIGVVVWLLTTYIPMDPPIKTVIVVITVLVLCLWLLSLFGIGNIYVGTRPFH